MFDAWLKPLTVASFSREYLRQQPFAQPDAAKSVIPLLTWETLDTLLRRVSADVLVVARGRIIERPRPRHLADLRLLMQHGIGVVLRRAGREDPALAELAVSFAHDLGGEAHIQLFVTPKDTHGFGWHYDREDVFIAQTFGKKEYFFRQNTVTEDVLHNRIDFEPFRRELSPLGITTLIPGDWLYIPSGWWHMAKCTADSLSISTGVLLDEHRQRYMRL
jgi:50S ribosomal protein L16 3-hydroxylase